MLNTETVHVWRDPNGDYQLEWQVEHPATQVTVAAVGASSANVNYHYSSEGARARVSGLLAKQRHLFRLRDEHGSEVVVSERQLNMQGTPNFRDFGGYLSGDGRRVKWGYLFRSGQLSALSERDVQLLSGLELDFICDFRREQEQLADVTRLPSERPPRIVSLPIVPGSNSRFFEEMSKQVDVQPEHEKKAMFDFMVEVNRDLAQGQQATYSKMFEEILAQDDARFLVHCAAGKDRTGFAVALVLMALGVSREIVMRDYLLTARYYHPAEHIERLKKKYDMEHVNSNAVLPMLEVHEGYLGRALLAIEQCHGSVEQYLAEALGVGPVELKALRARYLV